MKTTKRHNRLSRAVLTRLALAVLLLAAIGGVLTSCGSGGSTKITTLEQGKIIHTDKNGMSEDQLTGVADDITDHKSAVLIREKLVAALRGYDISTDAKYTELRDAAARGESLPAAEPDRAAELAKAVLAEYDITLAAPDKFNAADVATLVDAFKTEVVIEADRGVIDQLLHWIGLGFEWLIDVPGFGSFILGTVYFAIALEILMLPLGIHQQKNSRKQARLRPKEMAIRNKYKGRNDQATMQKLNQEIQSLYQKEGYSPMAGCLPLLITMPFLIFLYYIVIDPLVYMMGASEGLANAFLTYASAHPAAGGLGLTLTSSRGTIEVLAQIREQGLALDGLADFSFFSNGASCLAALDGMVERIPSFSLLGVNMGMTPQPFGKPYVLMLMPVLTFVVYWASGKITRKFTFQPAQAGNDPAQGCSNTMMNIMMPAMSAFFTFMVPAAVGLYWMFKSVIGTVKTIVIAKVMPLPTFTEEDYKAAERELAGKDKSRPAKRSGSRNPNVRSLHHIDDEDYETPAEREARLAARKAEYVEPEEEAPRTAAGAYGDGVTLKEDRPAESRRSKKHKKTEQEADASDEPAATDSEQPRDEQ